MAQLERRGDGGLPNPEGRALVSRTETGWERAATGPEINGVQVPAEGASTPSTFRGVASDESLESIEFLRVLDLVAGMASGPLGAEMVRARRPMADAGAIHHDLSLIAELFDLRQQGEDFDAPPVPPLNAVVGRLRIEGSSLDGSELVRIHRTLAAGRQIAGHLRRVADRTPHLATLLVPVPDRAVESRLERSVDPEGELLDTADPGLAGARRAVQTHRERLIRKLEGILHSLDGQTVPGGAAVTVRGGRYVIPVRRDSRSRPHGIVHDESGSAGTLFIEPTDAIEAGNALREAMQAEGRETHRVLAELTDLVRPHGVAIAGLHRMCVLADDAVARARYANAIRGAVPTLVGPGHPLMIRNGRHPGLLARVPDTVPFDLVFADQERTLVVSGPNAGGKTVLLKTVGLAAAMVQSGIVPPVGAGSQFPVFTRIFADIGDHQSIAADLSTFSAHAATLQGVLHEADAASLVLLDELGSGTDPAEGAALAWAALESLTRRGAQTVATTHLGALKLLAAEESGVVNGSLEFDAATLSPSYRFIKGVPGRSYGLAIARRLGVDEAVVARAEERVPRQEMALDALLHEAEARNRRLLEWEKQVAAQAEAVSLSEQNLEARAGLAADREAELRRREKDAERRARSVAQDYLLQARSKVEEAIQVASEADAARDARRAVEEALRDLRVEADADAAQPPGAHTVAAAVGDRVRLRSGGLGQVVEERGDGKLLVVAGSLRLVVAPDQVVELLPPAVPARSGAADSAVVTTRSDQAEQEIDLRGMRVDEAESAMLAAVDAAVLAAYPLLKVIHGKGTGAVRELVHELIRADRRVTRFALAPYHQGGSGVTIVEFRG